MNCMNNVNGIMPHKIKRIWYALRSLDFGQGVLAADIAYELAWPRRTVNRYLQALKSLGRATRTGWFWSAEGWTWNV